MKPSYLLSVDVVVLFIVERQVQYLVHISQRCYLVFAPLVLLI